MLLKNTMSGGVKQYRMVPGMRKGTPGTKIISMSMMEENCTKVKGQTDDDNTSQSKNSGSVLSLLSSLISTLLNRF